MSGRISKTVLYNQLDTLKELENQRGLVTLQGTSVSRVYLNKGPSGYSLLARVEDSTGVHDLTGRLTAREMHQYLRGALAAEAGEN